MKNAKREHKIEMEIVRTENAVKEIFISTKNLNENLLEESENKKIKLFYIFESPNKILSLLNEYYATWFKNYF